VGPTHIQAHQAEFFGEKRKKTDKEEQTSKVDCITERTQGIRRKHSGFKID